MADTELKGVISFDTDTDDAEKNLMGLADRLQDIFDNIKVGGGDPVQMKGPSGAAIGIVSGITTAVTQQILQTLGKTISSLSGMLLNMAKSLATASPTLTAMFGLFSTRLRLVALQIGEELAPSISGLLDILARFVETLDIDLIASRIDDIAVTILPKLGSALDNLADIISRVVNVVAQPDLSAFDMLRELREELTRRPQVTTPTVLSGNFASQAPFLADFLKNGLNATVTPPKVEADTQAPSEQKSQSSGKTGVIEKANQIIFGNAFEMMKESAKDVQKQREEMIEAERRAQRNRLGGLTPGLDF